MALPLLLAAGTALSVGGQLGAASANRRAADNRATALRAQAAKRLAKGKLEAGILESQGKMDQTSYAASRLSSGTDRETLAQDTSLDAISNRAKFAADQAISEAQNDAQSMMEDATAIGEQGRAAQKNALYGAAGSILGGYSSYLEGKYGKAAYDNFFGGKWS